MLHSISGQVEYIIALLDSIQDLVQLIIEYKEFLTKYNPTPATAGSQKSRPTPTQSRGKTSRQTANSHKGNNENTLLPNFQVIMFVFDK
jgi:hypothetical protein